MITLLPGFFLFLFFVFFRNALAAVLCDPEGTEESAAAHPVQTVKSLDAGSDLVSEVGVLAGDGPEGDLFVLLENDVISTEGPVEGGVNMTGYLELRGVEHDK